MQSVFIGGIPASGKSFLAKKISDKTGLLHLSADSFREEMAKDPKLEKWVNFYWNLDEKEYYATTSCKEQWSNLVKQSEAFWSTILKKVMVLTQNKQILLEGVNIMPHLASRDLQMNGVFLLGESEEIILERIKKAPRWGNTVELMSIEAKNFYQCERIGYMQEAKKYGFKTFSDPNDAEDVLLNLIKS